MLPAQHEISDRISNYMVKKGEHLVAEKKFLFPSNLEVKPKYRCPETLTMNLELRVVGHSVQSCCVGMAVYVINTLFT